MLSVILLSLSYIRVLSPSVSPTSGYYRPQDSIHHASDIEDSFESFTSLHVCLFWMQSLPIALFYHAYTSLIPRLLVSLSMRLIHII